MQRDPYFPTHKPTLFTNEPAKEGNQDPDPSDLDVQQQTYPDLEQGARGTVIASREAVLGGVGRRRWDAARVGSAGKRRWKSRRLKAGVGGGRRLTQAAVVEVRDDQ